MYSVIWNLPFCTHYFFTNIQQWPNNSRSKMPQKRHNFDAESFLRLLNSFEIIRQATSTALQRNSRQWMSQKWILRQVLVCLLYHRKFFAFTPGPSVWRFCFCFKNKEYCGFFIGSCKFKPAVRAPCLKFYLPVGKL